MIGNINAYSSMWNPHCWQKVNARLFKELIESYQLIVNVAPPTQGTWRSNDYVSAFRLVDAWLFLLESME